MFQDRIELIIERGPQFGSSDVGQLRLGDQTFCLCPDQFLFQDLDLCRLRVLIFQIRDLVADLVLPVPRGLHAGLDVPDALQGQAVLVVAVDELVVQLADLVDKHTQLVRDVGHVVVVLDPPQRQLSGGVAALVGRDLHRPQHVLLDLHQTAQLAGQFGTEGPGGGATEGIGQPATAEEFAPGGGWRWRWVLQLRGRGGPAVS